MTIIDQATKAMNAKDPQTKEFFLLQLHRGVATELRNFYLETERPVDAGRIDGAANISDTLYNEHIMSQLDDLKAKS